MQIRKITPVLVVDRIEPSLALWRALGFEVTAEVPEEDHLGFVILARDGVELMYQTATSVREDVPAAAAARCQQSIFIEVDALDAVQRATREALEAPAVLVPERRTFYGSTETIVREPGGHVVTFAQFAASHAPDA
jgi:Glyoxalase/Bleomycin resistance protein/Dioxygenase superfamily